MRQWTLSLAVVALIAGTTFAGKYNTKLGIGDKAPAIAGITAVAGDKESTIDLADIKEDVVVVAFLANHCPAVQANEDRLVDVAKAFAGKSVKFVGVCCSSSAGGRANGIGSWWALNRISSVSPVTGSPRSFTSPVSAPIRHTPRLRTKPAPQASSVISLPVGSSQ